MSRLGCGCGNRACGICSPRKKSASGPTGPTGPCCPGPTGATGSAGATGVTGPTGAGLTGILTRQVLFASAIEPAASGEEFTDLVAIPMVVTDNGFLEIDASFSLGALGSGGFLRLALDGVELPSTGTTLNGDIGDPQAIDPEAGAIIYRVAVAPGPVTVSLQWADAAGGSLVFGAPETLSHANLRVRETS